MAKVDIEIVQKVLQENGVDIRLTATILNQIREVAMEEAVEREKPAKKQHIVLVSEPEGGLPKDLVGWVVQILEDDDLFHGFNEPFINESDDLSTRKNKRNVTPSIVNVGPEGFPAVGSEEWAKGWAKGPDGNFIHVTAHEFFSNFYLLYFFKTACPSITTSTTFREKDFRTASVR